MIHDKTMLTEQLILYTAVPYGYVQSVLNQLEQLNASSEQRIPKTTIWTPSPKVRISRLTVQSGC